MLTPIADKFIRLFAACIHVCSSFFCSEFYTRNALAKALIISCLLAGTHRPDLAIWTYPDADIISPGIVWCKLIDRDAPDTDVFLAQAHTGPIFAISTYPDGFLSGGKDGRVRLWSGLDPVKVMPYTPANKICSLL